MLADLITRWATAPFDITNWTLAVLNRKPPQWSSDNSVYVETPFAKLRDFSIGDHEVTPTIILPPMAGHASTIVDFKDQSQVQLCLRHGLTNLYVIDWLGATAATRNTTLEDHLGFVRQTSRPPRKCSEKLMNGSPTESNPVELPDYRWDTYSAKA
jgi:poly-beta-hydroxyalkanoate depolymerase